MKPLPSKFLLLSLFLTLTLTLTLAFGAALPTQASKSVQFTPPQVYLVAYPDSAALAAAAARLDIWEVDHANQTFVALVTPAQIQWLNANGYNAQPDPAHSQQIQAPPAWPCYRTVDEMYAVLQTHVANHPDLTELINIGQSYEGRPLYVLRLAHEPIETPRPRLFLLANIHGREMITPEVALEYIALLLNGYGSDPDLTWLLDWREIYVMPSANPDGHIKNEQAAISWRKNTQPYGQCDEFSYGVDLNRNHSFKWGRGGSSVYACDLTYRGPSAASEPEVQALENYVRSLFPDARPDDNFSPAPDDTDGVLISLHSYSNLVLWPWGWSISPAPNSEGLSALGRKLAAFNGYQPTQSINLYPTSGTTDDWSYGELGIASYTFEIGGSSDGFFPSCARYDALVQPNLKALVYAAKAAEQPYLTSKGPEAQSATVWPPRLLRSQIARLNITLDDSANGAQSVQAGQWQLANPFQDSSNAAALNPSDGLWNNSKKNAFAELDTNSLALGRHTVFLRGQDSAGNWGTPAAAWFDLDEIALQTQPGDEQLLPGGNLSYTLTLTNPSAITLTLNLSQTLPISVTLLTAPGAELTGGQLTWRDLSLSPGSSLHLPVQLHLNVPALLGPLHSGPITLRTEQHLLPLTFPPTYLGHIGQRVWLPGIRK